MTKNQFLAAIEDASRAVNVAEDAIDAALANGADEATELELTARAREKHVAFNAACRAMGKAFPPPAGRIGDRGCGKRR